jgi:class 3 adenylate cyclase
MQSWVYFFYMIFMYLFFFIYQFSNYAANTGLRPASKASLVTYLSYFMLIAFYLLVNNYIYLRSEIASFNNFNLGASTSAKIEDFVDRLLPKHVRESVGALEVVGETADNVTLLFADIVGFTSYSSDRTPEQVVEMLSKLFTAFDKECNKMNLYKVYTIGDCYVVMSFLDKNNREDPLKECVDVVELGFKMIEIIAQVRREIKFDALHMRIGIHTGKIIGGIIGTGIIRYDLYGKDVLIANKMESSGKEDSVHISDATRELLNKLPSNPYKYINDEDCFIGALQTTVKTYFIEKIQK